MTSNESRARPVLRFSDGIRFVSGPDTWAISPLTVKQGDWIALVPSVPEPVVDPAGSLSRILATMQEPEFGTVELLERNVYRLDYGVRQRMRVRIGFVHGYGGLLSNRNIRENIALPVSVHGQCSPEEEIALVEESLRTFGLEAVEEMKPHEVDGATRWSVCLARALVLRPEWLVLEGIGSWEMDRGRSTGWKSLMEHRNSEMSTAICLPRQNPGFQSWFEKKGGMLIFYERVETPEQGRSR